MKTNLLTYVHPHKGSTTVLVEVPDIPVLIEVFDFEGAQVSVSLTSPTARNVTQVGPGDPHGVGVKVRATNSDAPGKKSFTGVLHNSFSFASSVGGSVIQCAGSLSMGLDKKPGLELTVPKGSFLDMRDHGLVHVVKGLIEMSLEQAVADGLLDVKFKNEL